MIEVIDFSKPFVVEHSRKFRKMLNDILENTI